MPRKKKLKTTELAVTPVTQELDTVPADDRRAIINKWTEENEEKVVAALDRVALIASRAKSDRDAVAGTKVLLDHSQGRAPEARESRPTQILIVNRFPKED